MRAETFIPSYSGWSVFKEQELRFPIAVFQVEKVGSVSQIMEAGEGGGCQCEGALAGCFHKILAPCLQLGISMVSCLS